MVKADAYNHGVYGVVNATRDLVDRYGVATVREGIAVRSLTDSPITVFSYTADDAKYAKRYNLTPLVHDDATLSSVIAEGIGETDVKIDTGMHRFGFAQKDELAKAVGCLRRAGVRIRAVHTHFYSDASRLKQYDRFSRITEVIDGNYKEIFSASGAICAGMYGDGVRAGLIAYQGAMTVLSDLIAIHFVKRGETVGYDGRYTATEDTCIGVVGGGYYDGIMRSYSGAEASINGKTTHIIGNVCMDVCFVELNGIDAKVGDTVTLVSPLTMASYARCARTTEYEVLTSVKGRALRRYVNYE